MRSLTATLLLSGLLATIPPLHAQVADNAELASLYRDDQKARDSTDIDWTVVSREDAQRRARVLVLLGEGQLRTATDYFNAAMVFQHGVDLADYRIAHALATLAATLDPERANYRWLVAASWDRMMTAQLQPQWYGTQFQGSDEGLFLYPVAEGAVDDAERVRMGVPTLAQSQARVGEMAASVGQQPRPVPPSIEQLRQERGADRTASP